MMQRLGAARGYTLIEIMMVVAIGLTLMSFATVSVGRAIKSARGDGALYTILSQLRNAGQAFGDPHVPAAIIADAVTVLSNNWSDWNSLDHPHRPLSRVATETWYRVAIGTGTSLNFPRPAGAATFGTDGGIPNFLRFLEYWTGNNINYRGSLGMLFTSRQAVGTFKCCVNVYSGPTRNFSHDTDFFDLSLLPPHTPFLTDVNITGFTIVTTQ